MFSVVFMCCAVVRVLTAGEQIILSNFTPWVPIQPAIRHASLLPRSLSRRSKSSMPGVAQEDLA